jgi:ArsR family transcriptional regulator
MEAAGTSQAIVSQQLRILKDQRVLSAKRTGNYVFYTIQDRSVLLLLNCIRIHQAKLHNLHQDFTPETLARCAGSD